jgi:hypothetical protein
LLISYEKHLTRILKLDGPLDCFKIIKEINLNPKNDGFGIRHFLRDNLTVYYLLQSNEELKLLVKRYFDEPVIIKSIYFDKPPKSNWPVNWHQDITINLERKIERPDFKNWRELDDRVVVQPNIELLKSILTFRIHLDKADKNNGALSLIDNSELDGVVRVDREYLASKKGNINLAEVEMGGVMMMSPLTIHSSIRSKSNRFRRRVIHLEIVEKSRIEGLPFIEMFDL